MSQRNRWGLPLLLVITVALTMVGCNRKTIYSHYEHTTVDGWEKTDTLEFCVPKVGKAGRYREEIGLRTNISYPFTGLTMIVEQQVTPSGLLRSDTLHARLMDDEGNVQGRGVSYYQYNYELCDLQLQENDSLTVRIRHHMLRLLLPGVTDIGVTLRRIAP